MDEFINVYNLPKPENINSLNKPVVKSEIKTVIKYVLKQKPGPTRQTHYWILSNFQEDWYQPILLNLLHRVERKETLPNPFCRASVISITKEGKRQPRKLETDSPDDHD